MNVLISTDGTIRNPDTLEVLGFFFIIDNVKYYMLNETLSNTKVI